LTKEPKRTRGGRDKASRKITALKIKNARRKDNIRREKTTKGKARKG